MDHKPLGVNYATVNKGIRRGLAESTALLAHIYIKRGFQMERYFNYFNKILKK